jgi:hypothetical protein
MLLFGGFLAVYPALSLHELVTTGTIDWTATEGRRSWPRWLTYSIGWAGLWFGLQIVVPLLKYSVRPLMFALDDEALEIGGLRIPREQVTVIRPRWWRGDVLVETERGNFSINPAKVAGGVTALRRAFPDRFEVRYLKDGPEWIVGR